MKKTVLIFAAAALLLVSCGSPGAEETAPPGAEPYRYEGTAGFADDPAAIEKAAGSVVKLDAYDGTGTRIASGSGFAIFSGRTVVTAAHVIVNMDYMIATRDDGETFRIDQVVGVDRDLDAAICSVPEGNELVPLTPAGRVPERGEKIAVIGSQFGVPNLVTVGNLCGTWKTEGTERLIFSAPVSSGSSGAPVFDRSGEVVGIVSGTYDEGQNINVAIPISFISSLYKNTEGSR